MICSVDISQTHCLLHLSRESTNVFFALIFPTIRQGKGQSLSPFAQVKLVSVYTGVKVETGGLHIKCTKHQRWMERSTWSVGVSL